MCPPRLQVSLQFLKDFGAVEQQSDGSVAVLQLGKTLNRLPLSLELGLSLVAAVHYKCSIEVAMIACIVAEGGYKVFTRVRSEAGHQAFPASSLKQQRASDGDHLVYLDIFSAWMQFPDPKQQQTWCHDNNLSMTVLQRASVLLSALHEAMQASNIALVAFEPALDTELSADTQLSQAVRKSLCAGHLRQLAKLAAPSSLQEGFWLAHQYATHPCKVQLHRSSALTDHTAAAMVLYSKQSGWAGSEMDIRDVSSLQPEWITDIPREVDFCSQALVENFSALMAEMNRRTFKTSLDLVPQVCYVQHPAAQLPL